MILATFVCGMSAKCTHCRGKCLPDCIKLTFKLKLIMKRKSAVVYELWILIGYVHRET